jgi:N-hydroxyarylamine O-acetyltransferase
MNVQAYLDRIGVHPPISTDLAGLRQLHRAHLQAISFENLDVQLSRPITTAIEPIYEKIVERRRGGWCYEMNGLLGWALKELGFQVTRCAGGVMREAMGDIAVGNHLVLRVELPEGTYLADVGFGDGPRDPVRIAPGEFSDGRFSFSLSQQDDDWWRFHNHPYGGAGSFDFRLAQADEHLLAEKCLFLQISERSPFVQNLVCQRHTEDGLTILRGRVLRKVSPRGQSESLLNSSDELLNVLGAEFGLEVPEIAPLWPTIVARHTQLFGQTASTGSVA